MSYDRIIDYSWLVIAAVWVIAALVTKRSVRREFSGYRFIQVIILVIGCLLIFNSSFVPEFLNRRIIPETRVTGFVGLLLTWAGMLFALWARFFLGTNWSAAITVKEHHQLIRTGPYAIVRHPIYSGFLLALLGTAVAFGKPRDFLGLILATMGWRLKSLVEERFMTEEFGAEYTTYRRKVKALVPFIW